MSTYIRITKTTNDCEFRRGKMLQVYSSNHGDYIYDEESSSHYGSLDELKNEIINLGGDCEIYEYDPDKTAFLKCRIASGDKFTVDKLYRVDTDKYNAEDESPFRYCIEGVEIMNSDLTAPCDYHSDPVTLFANIVTALGGEYSFFKYSFFNYLNETLPALESEYKAKTYEKYIPTQEELDKIREEMKNLLTTYDHPWTEHGIDAILEKWAEQKGELISAFMSHPNYNGNFQLVFSNETYVDNINVNAGYRFMDWVANNFKSQTLLVPEVMFGKTRKEWQKFKDYLNATMPLVVPIMSGDKLELMNYELFEQRRRKVEYIAFILSMFKDEYTAASLKEKDNFHILTDYIRYYRSDRVSKDFADYVNQYVPEVRAREGQKTTKVVGKVMKHYHIHLLAEYAKAYALYCDAINVIRVTRHTILSLHPIDFLTQSFGNSWGSCHTIDKDNKRNKPGDHYHGQYCSGTVSYMLDPSSFVLYTVNASYTGNTFYEQDKISRCMFHIGYDKIVQGRCYPQAEDGNSELYTQLRTLVQKVVSEMWGIPNMWKLRRGDLDDYIHAEGTNYRDFFHYEGCNISKFKYSESGMMDRPITIGHDPICTVCGNEHDEEGRLHCCRVYTCPECGAIVEGYEDYTVIDGNRYHDDCVFYCEYHDRYEPNSTYWGRVERYGNICSDAYEYGDFYDCQCCDDVYHDSDMSDGIIDDGHISVCPRCLEDYFTYVPSEDEYYHNNLVAECDHCNETYLRETLTEADGEYLCRDCLEDMRTEQTEGNEVA